MDVGSRLQQEYAELRRRYETITERIAALDKDLGQSLEAVREQVLREQRTQLAGERDQVATRMAEIEADQSAPPKRTTRKQTQRAFMAVDYDELSRMLWEMRADVAILKREVAEMQRWHEPENTGLPPTALMAIAFGGVLTLLLLIFLTVRIGLP